MKFLLASSNAHKAQELDALLNNSGLKIAPSPEKFDIIEDGVSFQENSFKKAYGYFQKLKLPTLADDSGLVIPARADILGVHSARYAPDLVDYKDKNEALLKELTGLKGDERKAYFVCYLCFYISPQEVYFFEGRVHGVIAEAASGDDGFGYDPIFLPDGQDGKSMAEVSDWKMQNSHRAKACHAAQKFFQGYIK